MTVALYELWTGIAVPVTILLGVRINRWVPVLAEYSIPPAVTGGLLIAILLAVAVLAQVMLTVLVRSISLHWSGCRPDAGGAVASALASSAGRQCRVIPTGSEPVPD